MHRFIQKTYFFGLILVLSLAACSQFSLGKQGTPSPTLAADLTPHPSIQLKPCKLGSSEAQCGTLKVYENRAARSGRMIELRVAVIKAQSEKPSPDPIFYLAGGPGVAATEDAAKGQQFPSSLSHNHDLVFVDQRGTGSSHRVLIPPSPDVANLSPAEKDKVIQDWVAKTLREMDMDPRFYTTSVAMDDLDEVREALGYDKINLFGHSYGATAAQYYLRQHESHVRTMVLSGGSLLDTPVFELWAQNGQRVLDNIFDRCQDDLNCQSAFPNMRAEFKALLTDLEKQPVTVTFTDPVSLQNATITYTPDFLAEIIRVMTLDARYGAEVPILIHRAAQEKDWSGITNFYGTYGVGDWGPQMMEHVIRCSEKWAAFDPAEVARLSEGSYLKGWYVSLAQNHASSCKVTPRGETPEGTASQTGSQVPVLIINGDADPQGPPGNMVGAKELWPNSLALVEPYQGHWLSDPTVIMCRWSIMDQFIQSGSTAGLNTGCLKNVHPPSFVMLDQLGIPTPTELEPTQIPARMEETLAPKPIFKTTIGELRIEDVRWVDEVNGVMPEAGEKLLLISISKPGLAKMDPSSFPLQTFDRALRDRSIGEVHISGDDGTYAVCSMAGWVGANHESFAMGFRIPNTAKTLQLLWPGNEPIDLHPDGS